MFAPSCKHVTVLAGFFLYTGLRKNACQSFLAMFKGVCLDEYRIPKSWDKIEKVLVSVDVCWIYVVALFP